MAGKREEGPDPKRERSPALPSQPDHAVRGDSPRREEVRKGPTELPCYLPGVSVLRTRLRALRNCR